MYKKRDKRKQSFHKKETYMQTQGTHHIRHRHAAVAKLCYAARLYTRDKERKRGRECETVRERECEKEHEDKVKHTIYLELRSCKRNLHASTRAMDA